MFLRRYSSQCLPPKQVELSPSAQGLAGRRQPRTRGLEAQGWRSSILLRMDAEFLHSRKESRAVHSQACGSTIGTADAPLTCGERPYDLITLPSFIFVSNAGYVGLQLCSFSSDLLDGMLLGMPERYR